VRASFAASLVAAARAIPLETSSPLAMQHRSQTLRMAEDSGDDASGQDRPARPARRLRRYQRMVLVICLVLAPAILYSVYRLSHEVFLEDLRARNRHTLELYVAGLRGELDRYRSIPRLIAMHESTRRLLTAPDDQAEVAALNLRLERINSIVNAADSYVMDAGGTTLAASNWNETKTFIGQNFSYRPYFQDAMTGLLGRYVALGTTSLKRGYYFAYPVYGDDGILGAAVVKIDIETLEEHWSSPLHEVVVADQQGVIFMSSRAEWLYATWTPLTPAEIATIHASRQYGDAPLRPFPAGDLEADGPPRTLSLDDGELDYVGQTRQRSFLRLDQSLPEAGWTVSILADARPVSGQAVIATLVAGVALAFLSLLAFVLITRRENLRERLALQQQTQDTLERAALDLERRVEERTVDLKRAQDELVQAAKLAALGQMSAGISHELNQPLTAIRAYARNALTYLERARARDVRGNLEIITELTARMAEIVRHLKTFARDSSGPLEDVSIFSVVADTLRFLDNRIRQEGVELACDLPERPIVVRADAVRLEQVLVNLIGNALDAMRESREKRLGITADWTDSTVTLRIRDTGPGIPDAIKEQIFDPFFTTKEVGEGLGLGLSISYSIVKDFGGRLDVDNHADGGALFSLTLERAVALAEPCP
jgi:two-component system C4-dicarboxylate transport sensor histidine kinase DctB